MQNKNLETLIPIAMKAIAKEHKKKNFTSTANGYFASYGPSILMAGVKQTVLYNHSKHKEINSVIFNIMKEKGWMESYDSLEKMVQDSNAAKRQIQKRLLEVLVACKLVIRTYELKEE